MDISKIRDEIDEIDKNLAKLLEKRMICSRNVAEYKLKNKLPVLNRGREEEVIAKVTENSEPEIKKYIEKIYENLFCVSKEYQEEILRDEK